MKAKAYHKAGVLNKTEAAYAKVLESYKQDGDILDYMFEAYTLKLADNTRYTPDFMVIRKDGTMEFHEVKGFWRDDAKVKIKVAAKQFPHRFVCAIPKGKAWEITDFTNENTL